MAGYGPTIDPIVDAATLGTETKRQRCVAAMAILDQAGITKALQDKIADLLYDEIDDFDDCQQPGESYEECCVRVEAEEKRLRDDLYLETEV